MSATMPQPPTFLVTLATGRQGSSVIRALLSSTPTPLVHALVRDPTAPTALALQNLGAQLFQATTLTDLSALTAACQGVTGLFLNTIPDWADPGAELAQAEAILSAAKAAGTVRTVVLSTSYQTADMPIINAKWPQNPIRGFYDSKGGLERLVKRAAMKEVEGGGWLENVVILRPSWLMHNYVPPFVEFHYPGITESRVVRTALGRDVPIAHVDAEDVGRFAARAFLEPQAWRGREVEMGAENLRTEEVVKTLNAVLGLEGERAVKVEYVEGEDVEGWMEKAPSSRFYVLANKFGGEVYGADKYGIKLTTLEEFFTREKEALLKVFG